jgi:hypothetical protein
VGAPLLFPTVQSLFKQLADFALSDFPKPLIESSQREILKSFEFGKKVAILITTWFTVLFAIELVLRVLFWVLSSITRVLMGKSIERESTVVSKETAN